MATQSIQQGWGQMTAAQRSVIQHAVGAGNGTRRTARRSKRAGKRTSAAKRAKPRKTAKRRGATRGKAHLVKGSAAAKRHMAKLRRMVGKRRR